MRRVSAFSSRVLKELVRDPLTLIFGIGMPVVLLLLLSAIQANIPVSLFEINTLAPGMAVFGLSFLSLFSGILVSKDRTTSFLMRLYTTPMKAIDFIGGYTLPMLPVAVVQCVACFLVAMALGYQVTVNTLLSLLVLLPTAILFIATGLLIGTVFSDKAVGGVSSILVNVAAWLSGIWFDLDLVGGTFRKISYLLPFAHAVDASCNASAGNYAEIFPSLWWVIGYAAVIFALAVFLFYKKTRSNAA